METYSVELAKEMRTRLPFEVLALPGRADGGPPGAAALVGFILRTLLSYALRPRTPDVLHIGDMASWPLALLAGARRKQPLVVISVHGTDVGFHRRDTLKGRLYRRYLRMGARLLRRARLIANSAATAAVAAETGWRTERIVPLATTVRESAAPDSHDGHLLFAGRLVERKGCGWFVRCVLPLLPPDVGLKVAGPVWSEREKLALNHPRVTYLGVLDGDEVQRAYSRALAVIVPNIELPSGEFEGFGLVAPEAAAAGGLVLAAATGGLVEAVLDEETGFLLPPGDASAWATRITEVAGWRREERANFLERSMQNARQVYSWPRVADDVLAVYQRNQPSSEIAG
jgi:glycosyltransferase involved in cell wall biosynthesis